MMNAVHSNVLLQWHATLLMYNDPYCSSSSIAPIAPAAPTTPEPIIYTYSTGNAFTKSNSKSYFMWRNIGRQLCTHSQWEVLGAIQPPWQHSGWQWVEFWDSCQPSSSGHLTCHMLPVLPHDTEAGVQASWDPGHLLNEMSCVGGWKDTMKVSVFWYSYVYYL